MALNFLGLGFLFGAKDDGLKKMQEKLALGFFDISQSVAKLNKDSQPLFQDFGGALDKVNSTLEAQQATVAKWSQGIADSIDKVGEFASRPVERIKALFGTMEAGANVVSNTWANTFGKSFEALGEKFDTFKQRIGGLWEAASPLTSKFSGMWKRISTAMSPFGTALQDGWQKMKNFVGGFKETDDAVGRGTDRFKGYGGKISKTTQIIMAGFSGISTVIRKMNEVLRINRLRGLIESVSLGMLGKIAGGIQGLGDAGMNLTTGLEATMAGLSKESRKTAVNLGLVGSEARKVAGQAAGMAYGLNIGASQATEAIVGFNDAQKEMSYLGIKSAKDMAIVSEQMGVNGKDFAFMLKHMKSLGMGEAEISKVVSSFTAMGQETRDVSGALGSVTEMMTKLEQKAALMGEKLDPKNLADFAAQTAALAAGLGKMGKSADEARQISMGLADSIIANQKEFQNLFSGTATDMPEFSKELAVISGDIDTAFGMIAQGPQGFVEGLQHMVSSAKKQGVDVSKVMDFMRARLEKAGIQGVEPLVNFLRSADEGVFDLMKTVRGSKKDLAALAKEGFSTGITLAEAFDRAKEAAIAHFRAGGKAGTTFLTDFTKSAEKFNATLDKISKEGGPLGNFVDKLRDVHKLGAAGLLPREMQGAGILLGEIVRQLGPLLGLLGGAIMFFPGLTAVLGPVVAILGVFAINLFKAKMAGQSWADAIQTAFGETEKILVKAVDFIKSAIEKLGPILAKALPMIGEALGKVLPMIFEAGGKLISTIVDALAKYAPQLADAAISLFDKMVAAWMTNYPKLIAAFQKILGKIVEALPTIIPKLVQAANAIISAIADAIKVVVPLLAQAVVELVPAVVDALIGIVPKLIDAVVTVAPKIFDALVQVVVMLAQKLPELLGELVPKVIGGLELLIKSIIENLPKIAEALLGFIKLVVDKLPEWLPMLIDAILGLIDPLVDAVVEIVLAIVDALPVVLPKLVDAFVKGVLAIVNKLPEILPKLIDAVGKILLAIVDMMPKILPALIEGIKQLIDGLVKVLPVLLPAITDGLVKLIIALAPALLDAAWATSKMLFEFIFWTVPTEILPSLVMGILEAIWNALANLFYDYIVKPLGDIWVMLQEPLEEAWNGFVDAIETIWNALTAIIKLPFEILWAIVETVFDAIWPLIEPVITAVGDLFDWLGTTISAMWDSAWAAVKEFFGPLVQLAKVVFKWMNDRWNELKRVAVAVWDAIWGKVEEVLAGIKNAWDTAWKWIEGLFNDIKRVGVQIWDDIVNAAKGVWDKIKEAWGDVKGWFKGLWDGLVEAIREPWDAVKNFITGIWDNPDGTGIKNIWEKATGFFRGLWDEIARIMNEIWGKIKEKAADALGPLWKLFEMLDGWIEKLFGNSIDTDVDESMSAASSYMSAYSLDMIKTTVQMGEAVENTYNKTFSDILSATDAFIGEEIQLIKSFTTAVVDEFAAAFAAMSDISDILSEKLRETLGALADQLNEAARVLSHLAAARMELKAAKEETAAEEVEKTVVTRSLVQLEASSMLTDAINMPKWYKDGARGQLDSLVKAQQLFNTNIIALLRAALPEASGKARGSKEIRTVARVFGERDVSTEPQGYSGAAGTGER